MKKGIVSRVIIICVLSQAPVAFAVPIAQWGGPWQPTLSGGRTAFGENSEFSRRGISDLGSVFEPLPGTGARARAAFAVSSNLFRDDLGATQVRFQRQLQLLGSPNGWDVTLRGDLIGQLRSSNPGRDPLASVIADARISPFFQSPNPLSFELVSAVDGTPRNANFNIRGMPRRSGILGDGIYTVRGQLEAFAQVNGRRLFQSGGSASSDFFTQGFGFRVFVDARPIAAAEPATLLLFGSGVVGLLYGKKRGWPHTSNSSSLSPHGYDT